MSVPLALRLDSVVMLFPPTVDDYLVVTHAAASLRAAQAINRDAIGQGLLGRTFPDARAIPLLLPGNVTAAPNVEAMLRMKPDAVFASAQAAATLERAGLPALGIRNTLDERWPAEQARIYAEAHGDQERGPELLERYRAGIASVAADLAAAQPRSDTRALMTTSYAGATYAVGAPNLLDDLLRAAGGANAAPARGAARLDRERLLSLDPDMLVLLRGGPVTPDTVRRDPVWRALRSVRQGRVYRVPPGLEFLPDGLAGFPLLVRWLAELLHPDLPVALRAEMRKTYLRETGRAMSEADLDEALGAADNTGSLDAARFLAR